MVVYLAVWEHSPMGSKQVGTIEMGYQVSPNGEESRGWEWRASGKGNPDGGGWAWIYEAKQDRVAIELTSGVRKVVVARMRSSENWKGSKIPPNEPWFKGSFFSNLLEYTDPNGKVYLLGWEPVK